MGRLGDRSLKRRTVAIHASTIECRGRAVLFLGESGTGKSTHTRLWLQHIAGSELLNDDSPFVGIATEGTMACGSPWSGKTHCYKQRILPVAAMVRLSQASRNHIRPLSRLAAIGAVLPSSAPFFACDGALSERLDAFLSPLLEQVPVYHLECLPDGAAARLVYETLNNDGRL